MTSFWKIWGSKTGYKKAFIPNGNGLSNDVDIENRFVDKFKFNAKLPEKYVNYGLTDSILESNLMFSVGKIDSANRSILKLCKAAGLDGVQSEHIVYAHPAVVMHLRNFFKGQMLRLSLINTG